MAFVNVDSFYEIQTPKCRVLSAGEFVGKARIKAMPDHVKNEVKFSFAGYKGMVTPTNGYTDFKWSFDVDVTIGMSSVSMEDAKNKAKKFTIAKSPSKISGEYPVSWTIPTKKDTVDCIVGCNDWGSPDNIYIYFSCRNDEVQDPSGGTLNVAFENALWASSTHSYICDRVPPISKTYNRYEQDEDNDVGYFISRVSTDISNPRSVESYVNNGWKYSAPTYSYSCSARYAIISNNEIKIPYKISSKYDGSNPSNVSNYYSADKKHDGDSAMVITTTNNKNGLETTNDITPDLRIPKIEVSNIEFLKYINEYNKYKMTFTIATYVDAPRQQCYVYGIQYSLNDGEWMDLNQGTVSGKTFVVSKDTPVREPITFSIDNIEGKAYDIRLRVIRQATYRRGYTSFHVDATQPEFSGDWIGGVTNPEYHITDYSPEDGGSINCEFWTNSECNYRLQLIYDGNVLGRYDGEISNEDVNAAQYIYEPFTFTTDIDANLEFTLRNKEYDNIYHQIWTTLYSQVPCVDTLEILNDAGRYYIRWKNIHWKYTSSYYKEDVLLKAYSVNGNDYTPLKLDGKNSEEYIISTSRMKSGKVMVDLPESDNVVVACRLFKTTDIIDRIDGYTKLYNEIKEVGIENTTKPFLTGIKYYLVYDHGKYNIVVRGLITKNHDRETPIKIDSVENICPMTFTFQGKTYRTNAFEPFRIDENHYKYNFEQELPINIDSIKKRLRLRIDVDYHKNNINNNNYVLTFAHNASAFDGKFRGAYTFLYTQGEWRLVSPHVYTSNDWKRIEYEN